MRQSTVWLLVTVCVVVVGCRGKSTPAPPEAVSSRPGQGNDTWHTDREGTTEEVYSADGKMKVTVWEGKHHTGSAYVAEQIRIHYDREKVADAIFSWRKGDCGWHPLFSDVLRVDENVYVMVGHICNGGGNIDVEAWVVAVGKRRLCVGKIETEGAHGRARFLLDLPAKRLGLCVQGEYGALTLQVLDERLNPERLAELSVPITSERGTPLRRIPSYNRYPWFGTLENYDPERVLWFDILKIASGIRAKTPG